MHFCFIDRRMRTLETSGREVIKIQKSSGKSGQKTLEIQGKGIIKRKKSRGGSIKLWKFQGNSSGAW